jgi:hypothetical protein
MYKDQKTVNLSLTILRFMNIIFLEDFQLLKDANTKVVPKTLKKWTVGQSMTFRLLFEF